MQKQSTTADFLRHQIDTSNLSQRDIAKMVGFNAPNLITMIKLGDTKMPIDKIPKMAKVLKIDATKLLKMAMEEYSPTQYEAIAEVFGEPITKAERKTLELLRRIKPSTDYETKEEIAKYLSELEELLTR